MDFYLCVLSGVYFSLLTLSFAAMTFYIIYRWTHFTGGEDGYGGMERPTLFGIDLNNQTAFFYMVMLIFIAVVFLINRLVNSPFGSVLTAIRENSQRASFIGYDVKKYRLISFTLSAFFCWHCWVNLSLSEILYWCRIGACSSFGRDSSTFNFRGIAPFYGACAGGFVFHFVP